MMDDVNDERDTAARQPPLDGSGLAIVS